MDEALQDIQKLRERLAELERQLQQDKAERRISSEWLSLGQRAAQAGFWCWDILTGKHTATPELYELFGLRLMDELTLDLFKKILHPDDLGPTLAKIYAAVQEHKPFVAEYRIIPSAGQERWLRSYGLTEYDDAGQPQRMCGICIDISDLRRAEQELRSSEERLRLFIEHTPAAVAMFDREMRYLATSGRWLRDYRLKQPDIVGRSHYEVFPEITERWKEIHRRSLAGAVEKCEEDPFPRADGSLDWIRWEIHPWLNARNEIGGIIMFTENISERKRAEERLRQKQKLESLGVLAGGLAHDFNNLLVGVIGYGSLALESLPPNHPAREYLKHVLKAGEEATNLTRQMLAYSGKGRFMIELVNLSELIPELRNLIQRSISRNILQHYELAEDLPLVEADRGQLQQVFMNLVLNAAESIESGSGEIWITTGVRELAENEEHCDLEATEFSPGKYVYLEVRDTGCGMDEATRAKIFDPFFSTKFTGRGLGLAAVAGIVRGHRGAIQVTSVPGQGSCFTVFFPVRPQLTN